MKKPKIMIGTPCYGAMCTSGYMTSMVQLGSELHHRGISFTMNVLGNESLVQRARNIIAHGFMASDCTHLLWVDADIQFQAEDVLTLLDLNVDIVGGNYPLKNINWDHVRRQIKAGKPDSMIQHCASDIVVVPKAVKKKKKIKLRSDKPFEVDYLGTGFMLTTKAPYLAFQKRFPDRWCHEPRKPIGKGDKVWLYYDCMNDKDHVYLSEDYYFCAVAQQLGFKIHMAPWIQLQHWGNRGFEGCYFCSQEAYIHEEN